MYCVASALCPEARKRNHWSTRQNRTQINLHLVNQPRIERSAKDLATALNQNTHHTSFTQVFQHTRQRFSFINERSPSQLIRKQSCLSGQITRTGQHDAPGLSRPTHGYTRVV